MSTSETDLDSEDPDEAEPTNVLQDLEETDAILEYAEPDPVEFWESKQRDLLTSHVDYNLRSLSDLITTKVINLSPRYQRRARWDRKRQSKLVESFLMNVPVPPIFLNEDDYGQYSVIDGKQRLTAIHEFSRGRLKLAGLDVFRELNGATIDDLPPALKNALETRATLRAIIILRQSDKDIKFEVFRRLNTGGVRLNAQEIRNSVWTGPFNDLILDLSEHKRFQELLGIKDPKRSAIYREMRDAEFVLRYFTFRDRLESFTSGMKRAMDEFMSSNQRWDEAKVEAARTDFLSTLETVATAFGDYAFKRWVPERQHWRQQVLAALFDAEMFACRGLPRDGLQQKRPELINALKDLFEDSDFRRSIDAATNTPILFQYRIERMRQMVTDVLAR